MAHIVILIPTYNEAETIRELLKDLTIVRNNSAYNYDVVVIDDNSPDNTATIVEELSLTWVNVIRRPEKNGLGEAYRAGISSVLLNSNYSHVVTMDADGSHRVVDLLAMIDSIGRLKNQKNVIMGARWIPGGNVVNWPRYRQFISKFGTKYAKLALTIDLSDLTGGFRIYSSKLLKSFTFSEMDATGYCFQVEMALASKNAGADVLEVPITFVERQYGRSKMTAGIALEAFGYVTKAGIKRIWKDHIRR